jgi:outer membrane protein
MRLSIISAKIFTMYKILKTFSAPLCSTVLVVYLVGVLDLTAHPDVMSDPVTPSEMQASVMTLDAMFERIREASPEFLFEREKVRRALEESIQERAALLPQVTLTASQIRRQLGLGFAGDAFESKPFDSFGSRVELTQTLFDTEQYANYELAKLEHAIATMDYEVVYQDILDRAVNLYFTQLRDLNQKKIIETDIVRSRELLQLASDRFEGGAGVAIDVTRAKARLTSDERELWIAKVDIQSSGLQLKALLDMDLDADLRLDESLIDHLSVPPRLEDYRIKGDAMIDLRPELVIQKKRLDQAKLIRKAAAWQRLPSVELFGDWGYDGNDAFQDLQNEVWLMGVRASMPVFEGLRISAQKRNAAAALRQQVYQTRILEKEIEREFRTALFEMNARYKEIELAEQEIEFGHIEVEQAFSRYHEGLVDNRELIDAQQRLADAERSYLNSAYQYSLSRLAFARSIGVVETVLD